MKQVILASASPWRKKLLAWLGVDFEVRVSDFDESKVACDEPDELVMTLALEKAKKVASKIQETSDKIQETQDVVVIGADTVIVLDGEIIGKPRDEDHAREIIRELKGREHEVYTGVAVINMDTGEKTVEYEKTTVAFRDFSDEELDEFMGTREWEGKAGAYQILMSADRLIEQVEGSITGVVGLPLKRLAGMLEEMGVEIEVEVEEVVWEKTGHRD